MNGAESLIKTLENCGVEVCFANPGTTELHLVSAIDGNDSMRSVLGLFEGVIGGAGDGYARMKEKPAACLFHMGPGFTNGMANLHNAKRARVPLLNIIGDHATYFRKFDAPLSSDIPSLAKTVSGWFRVSENPVKLPSDGAAAYCASMEGAGQISTLIVPSDCAWSESAEPMKNIPLPEKEKVSQKIIKDIAATLKRDGQSTAILMGGMAVRGRGL